MGSQLAKMNNPTESSNTVPSSKNLFVGWRPANFQRDPNNVDSYEKITFDDKLFKELYGRDPNQGENVEGLAKAGIVLNCVFGLSPPPKNMTQQECKLIVDSANIMMEKDKSIGFGLAMAIQHIKVANPHCDKFWV